MRYFAFVFSLIVSISLFGQTVYTTDSLSEVYIEQMRAYFRHLDSSAMSERMKTQAKYKKIKSFIKAHPQDGAQFISWGTYFDSLQVDTLYKMLDPSIQQRIVSAIKSQKKRCAIMPGAVFPDIHLKDTLNHDFKIADLKGKIVLIDLWASWCRPCREQIPQLKLLYEKYKDKGLVIIGVSLDDDKEKWLNAIEKDNQPWLQFCELKTWNDNSMLKEYGINEIPYNFLINRQGKLSAKEVIMSQLELNIKKLL